MIDPRVDPRGRDNPPEFWQGYGAREEGKWYTDGPHTTVEEDHWMAGWCHSLAEKHWPKPWWKSSTMWAVIAEGALAAALVIQPQTLGVESRWYGVGVAGHAFLMAILRIITKKPIH